MEQELIHDEIEGQVPVCGGNIRTPVEYREHYIDEIHYTIGGRLYIEGAD